jgi:hypothetical protein
VLAARIEEPPVPLVAAPALVRHAIRREGQEKEVLIDPTYVLVLDLEIHRIIQVTCHARTVHAR